MATWNNNSLRGGQKLRNTQGGDRALSKLLELGNNYRLFFKTFVEVEEIRDEAGNVLERNEYGNIRAAVVPGRTGDYKVIGTSFIPYTDEMYTVDPITGQFEDVTLLKDWARIARVLFEAQCNREKKNAEAEAQRAAEEIGRAVDTHSLSNALEAIELKYHGGESAKGDKIMPDVSPAISSNIVFKVSTRIAVVKLAPNGTPDWKNAKYAVYETSKAKTDELIVLLDNPQNFNKDNGYLEVGYSYIGDDKKKAGQSAKFQGIAASVSLAETYPAEWAAIGKAFVDNIATGNDQEQIDFIRSRNIAFKNGKTPSDVVASYRKWCATNQAVFGSINFEDDAVAKAAQLFLENHLVDSMPKQLAAFQQLVEENNKKRAEEEEAREASDVAEETVQQAAPVQEEAAKTEAPVYDEKATAEALSTFASGAAETQTLRDLAEHADGLDISSGDDGDLGDLGDLDKT